MATPELNWVSTSISPLSGNRNVDSLIGGTQWGAFGPGNGATITYSVPQAGATWSNDYAIWLDNEPSQFSPLDSTQADRFRAALQAWSDVANITFVEIDETPVSVGEIRVGYSGILTFTSAAAWAYLPSDYPEAGDIWLDPNYAPNQDFAEGSDGYSTLLHELGHALGLKHSFESFPRLPKKFDTLQYTVMSYTDSPYYATLDYPETPMLYDIAAIQYLYGANMTYHDGDDIYQFSNTLAPIRTIWDAGGDDALSASNQTLAAIIDLRAGTFSSIGPDHFGNPAVKNIAIAYGVTIENATGGSGNDLITGNAGDNLLDGGAGADTMYGGLGNDTYLVDNAGDIASEKKGDGLDTVISEVSTILGKGLENLTLAGIDNLNGTGNKSANVLAGNAGDNTLNGLAGNDRLIGGEGNDTLIGGKGLDTFVFDTLPGSGNVDVIQDFSVKDDTIELDFAIFSALSGVGTLAADELVFGSVAQDANDHIIYNSLTGFLYYDDDGNGVDPAAQIAILAPYLTLTNLDFFVA